MRMLALIFTVFVMALPAAAQMHPPGVQALAEELDRRLTAPRAAADGAKSPRPLIGLLGPAEPSAADKNGSSVGTASAGWFSFRMSVCGAAVYGSSQYMFAFTTSGNSFVTQSAYATPVLAANCASGRSLMIYIENDGSTVSGIASYVF